MSAAAAALRWLTSLGLADISRVGGKNASLGEPARKLASAGVVAPTGFALTALVYQESLSAANAWPRPHALLGQLDISDVAALARATEAARAIVDDATGTAELRALIADAYAAPVVEYGPAVPVERRWFFGLDQTFRVQPRLRCRPQRSPRGDGRDPRPPCDPT